MANVALPLRSLADLSWPSSFARMAPHDWVLLIYHVAFLVLVVTASERSLVPTVLVAGSLTWLLAVLVLARGLNRSDRLASALYRLSLVALPVVSYVELRWVLPVVAPRSVDASLLAFDLRVFGFEPALSWDRWVNPYATEWFSFFYYSYFVLLAVHALPIALFAEDAPLLREFACGLLTVFCVGQLAYVVVPGLGPHAHVATFATPLEGRFFWPLVRDTVASAGAGADIFPSLHTAVPVFLTYFSYRHRDRTPFRYSWPVIAFFATQIIVATMYLRWHWLADIVAGVMLAVAANLLAQRVAAWETRRRARHALGPTFAPPLRLTDAGVR